MASSDHKTKIEIKIDDTAATASIDRIVSQLEKAQELAANLNLSGTPGGTPGGPPQDPQDKKEKDDEKRDRKRQTTAFDKAVKSLEGMASAVSGGGPAAHLQMFKPLVDGIRSVTDAMSPIAGGVGGVVSTALNTMIAGTQARMAQFGQIAGAEPGNAMTTYLGGGTPGFDVGASLGFGPQAASQILSNYYKTIGSRDMANTARVNRSYYDPFLTIRRGEDPNIAARIMSQGVAGGGLREDRNIAPGILSAIRGSFSREGFRGSNIDRLMGGISSLVETLQKGGSSGLDLGKFLPLTASQSFRDLGLRTMNPYNAVAQMGVSAADEILSPFQDLAREELVANAFSGGRGYAEAAQYLRDFGRDPMRSTRFLAGMGTETIMGTGLSLSEARGFESIIPELRGAGVPGIREHIGDSMGATRSPAGLGSLQYSTLFAQRQADLMDTAAKTRDPKAIFDLMTTLNTTMMELSEETDELASILNDVIKEVVPVARTAIQILKRLLP